LEDKLLIDFLGWQRISWLNFNYVKGTNWVFVIRNPSSFPFVIIIGFENVMTW